MSTALQTYLHDHYSGSTFAVELLETLVRDLPNTGVGTLAREILTEVNRDRATLHSIIERVGPTGSDLKDVAAWVSEKLTRAKLGSETPDGLGTFEALETLSLGILGKRSLWRTLKTIAPFDARLAEWNMDSLIQSAEDQYARVEQCRLRTIELTFGPHAV